MGVVMEADLERLRKSEECIRTIAAHADKEFGNDEDMLSFVADRLPDIFTKGSRFERPKLRALAAGEKPKRNAERWLDLIADVASETTVITVSVKEMTQEEWEAREQGE
jgi:hypothetical protein